MSAARILGLDRRASFNVGEYRDRLKMSRAALSVKTGLSAAVIERIENPPPGRKPRRISIGELVVIAEAFGIKPGEMLK